MLNLNREQELIANSVFTVGNVLSVKGKSIVIKINKNKNLPHLFFKGRSIKNVSVGLSNYVKILKGFTRIICKVEGEYLEEDKYQKNKKYISEKEKMDRFLNVSVFGFYDNEQKFQHGIREMPLIGSECRLLSKKEFVTLHKLTDENELAVKIGSLIDEDVQDISLSVKKLFAGHIGIFGNTGSGKSNTLAKIYTELFNLPTLNEDFKLKSKFIFIDFNGEYSKDKNDNILTKEKVVYRLNTKSDVGKKYPILKTEIEKLELLSILLDATEKTQQPFLHRAIDTQWFDEGNKNYEKQLRSLEEKLKKILLGKDKGFDKPFLERFVADFKDVGFLFLNKDNSLSQISYNSTTSGWYFPTREYINDENIADSVGPDKFFNISVKDGKLKILQKIQFKILNRYYYEILNGYANQEHIGPLISRLKKRVAMLGKVFDIQEKLGDSKWKRNIEIVDLKNVNLEMKKVIPLLICKTNYDEQKEKRNNERNNSLNIIIDEAHNILSENSTRESESWKDYRLETFEEIIKEGRKFGVFLTIASQRPSDISPTIISQLHNYFIHRLMNENDLRAINKAVSYLDKPSFDSISNLSVGCCFVVGQMTQFPLSAKIILLPEETRTQSETVDLDALWRKK